MGSLRTLVLLGLGAIAGGGLTFAVVQATRPAPTPSTSTASTTTPPTPSADPPATAAEDPPYRSLDANLFMQTAAEYRACCLQAFALAEQRLRHKAALRNGAGKPAAVMFDLDETVLDNAAFQTRQIRDRLAYDQKRWDAYEETDGGLVGLIPGAKEFILKLRWYEASPVYISNRNDKYREQTKAILARHGIAVPDDQLLLATKTSDKTERRKQAADKFDVLLIVGDNLRDFDEAFRYDKEKGPDGRKAAVDARRDRFGDDWIILPNPAYGEWTKPLGRGAKDADLLGPKTP
jgi:acid phosphatase